MSEALQEQEPIKENEQYLEDQKDSPEETERTSGIMRVLGVPLEGEKEILAGKKKDFDNQKILDKERERTPEELEIINGILKNLPEFIKKYGGKMLPLRPEHVHVIDYNQFAEEEKKKLGNIRGRYTGESQFAAVLVNKKEENNLTFALRVAHELIHFCSFQSLDANPKEKTISQRIVGSMVATKEDGEREYYFSDFNEAVTEELVKRFDEEFFKTIPVLSENVSDREKFREIIKNKPTDDPDRTEKKAKEVCNIITIQQDSGMWKSIIERYKFGKERKKLWLVIEDIYQNNKKDFKTNEEVFDVFAKAYFMGNLLRMAKLIGGVYGKGSFRKLGKETKEKK